ncbi:cytidine deaminase [Hymenobacter terricola]|uniref:cytidine deaminase n=1 Tax=Hymenobacter terricola TaxID=2819236 RepID=UPI001B30BB91|nr:cytidine deaminase [Hymenobacter terricola]
MASISRQQLIAYEELDSTADLSADEQTIWQAARDATAHSYAPYSGFCVGAALLLADGTVFRGTNQENAAYPSGLCAERTALFGLAANQPNHAPIVAMAVAARPAGGDFGPALPCGACRQVMLEYETRQGQPIPLLLPSRAGTILRFSTLAALMPFNFSADDLPPASPAATQP